MNKQSMSIDDYLSLPYTVEVTREQGEEGAGWFARVLELPGCMTQADSFAELGEMIQDAMRAWIETALELERPVPEPRPPEDYSGKFVVRVPKSLHRELAQEAERQAVSLNAFVNVALAKAIGASGPAGASASRSGDLFTYAQSERPAALNTLREKPSEEPPA
jgi:antitoxin HicB